MALSPAFDLAYGPLTVAQAGYTSSLASVGAMRGALPLSVQVCKYGVRFALPTGKRLWFGVKLPAAIKGDWLALCELVQPEDGEDTDPYLGELALNNGPIRAAMHAEVSDPTAELTSLPAVAEIYYTDADGFSNAVPGQNFNFTIGAPLVNGTEGIAPNPNPEWPTSDQLNALVGLTDALTGVANLFAAGAFLRAPLTCDFSLPRNAHLAAL